VSQDYSNVNYSSAKMASADSWRHYEVMREDLIGDLAMPMVDAFLEEVFHSGALKLPKGIKPFEFYDAKHALIKGVFLTQGAPNLDPVKEAQAAQMEIAMGAKTLQDICAENGEDYLDKLDQLAAEHKARAVRGLVPVAPPAAPPASDEKPEN
jgi:capsid protein